MRKYVLVLMLCASWNLATAQVHSYRYRVSEEIMRTMLVKSAPAQYPADIRVTGTVVLRAVIDKEGVVTHLQVVSGHPMLVLSAIEAAKQYRYKPYKLNGEPVEVDTKISIHFAPPAKPTS